MTYVLQDRHLDVIENEYIGSGTQWNVYRITLKENINVNNITTHKLIYKKPISSDQSIDDNIEMFNAVSHAGLPTLSFFIAGYVNNERVIYAEDLNSGNFFYVSNNSSGNTDINIKNRFITLHSNTSNLSHCGINKITNSQANELKSQQIGIKSIRNYKEIIEIIQKDMILATQMKLLICADSYFFGIDELDDPKITYRIADFDNISRDEFNECIENPNGNTLEMLNSFGDFIVTFVEIGKKRIEYENKLLLTSRSIQ